MENGGNLAQGSCGSPRTIGDLISEGMHVKSAIISKQARLLYSAERSGPGSALFGSLPLFSL